MVDPLDGTTNFLHGMPHWAISIGLERRLPDGGSELAAGLIYAPAVDEMFWAEKGGGAFVNERRLRVSARRELKDAVFATGIPFAAVRPRAARRVLPHAGRADAAGRGHPPVRRRRAGSRLGRRRPVRRLLGAGAESLGLAAGLLLVREAGGFATDPAGGDPRRPAMSSPATLTCTRNCGSLSLPRRLPLRRLIMPPDRSRR